MITLTRHACKYKVHKLQQRYINEDVPLVEFMYLVFTRVPGELPGCTSVGVYVPCVYKHAR